MTNSTSTGRDERYVIEDGETVCTECDDAISDRDEHDALHRQWDAERISNDV